MKHKFALAAAAALCAAASLAFSQETVDLSVIHRIKAEAFENSQVMDHIFYLTGSHGYKEAGDWVVSRLKEYGLANVQEEPWGPFGRGWTYSRFAGHMIAPQYQPLIGAPLAWTPGTNGAVQGEAIYAPIATEADLEKFKGKLRGKVVLIMPLKTINMIMEPPGHRLTDTELEARAQMTDPARLAGLGAGLFAGPGGQPPPEERERRTQFRRKMNQFLKDEGALVVLQYGN